MSSLPLNEFARPLIAHEIGATARHDVIAATSEERAALCARFDLVTLDELSAELATQRVAEGVRVMGSMIARGAQPCVVSGEPVPFSLKAPVDLLFVASDSGADDEEIELDADDLDVMTLDGDRLDIGESVAQTLSLILDPYPRADAAVLATARKRLLSEEEAAARAAQEKAASSPFSALQGAADRLKSR